MSELKFKRETPSTRHVVLAKDVPIGWIHKTKAYGEKFVFIPIASAILPENFLDEIQTKVHDLNEKGI